MASSRAIEAGKAFLKLHLDDNAMRRGIDAAARRMRAFGATISSIGARMAGVGAVMSAPFIASIKAAGDAQETLSKFKAVFGAQAGAAEKFADTLAKSIGRSSLDIKQGLSAFQAFFVGLGFGPDKARQLSQSMSALSLDFASFHNLADEDAMGRFISAMSGSSEVLDQFGINIKQAALQQELLRMGITKSWTAVTEQEKALARLNIIMRSMGQQGATGDAARTAGSFSNQMKRLKAQVSDLAVAIGSTLIPPVTKLVALATSILGPVVKWIAKNGALVSAMAALAAGTVGLGVSLMSLGLSVKLAAFAFTGLSALLGLLLNPITLVVAAIIGLGVAFVKFTSVGQAALKSVLNAFAPLLGIAQQTMKGIADALAAGDIQLAADVLWAGLKLAWLQGTDSLRKAWNDFKDVFMRTTIDMVFGAQEHYAKFASAVKSIWAGMVTESKTIGEKIGHHRTRSSDPVLAAEQDAAHNAALGVIKGEGAAELTRILGEKTKALEEIAAARATAEGTQDTDANAAIKKQRDELNAAKARLSAAAAAAAGLAAAGRIPQPGGKAADALANILDGAAGGRGGGMARSTSNARLAPQIFGSGSDNMPRKQWVELKKISRTLETIERKKAFAMRVGGK